MKLIDKIKDILSVEDEEVEQEEVAKPESEEYQFEETFKFPAVFEDEDLLEDFEMEPVQVEELPAYQPPKRDITTPKLTKKPFKPSPVISPVYGVIGGELDKPDYEDEGPSINLKIKETTEVTFDMVREKAYGNFENEIERVIDDGTNIYFNLETKEEEDNLLDDYLEEDKDISEITLEEAEESYDYRGVAINGKKRPSPSEVQELVDSMYEEED